MQNFSTEWRGIWTTFWPQGRGFLTEMGAHLKVALYGFTTVRIVEENVFDPDEIHKLRYLSRMYAKENISQVRIFFRKTACFKHWSMCWLLNEVLRKNV